MIINFCIFLLVFLLPIANYHANIGEYEKNILIIHSYHQNFEWTDELNRGLFEELNPNENKYFTQIEYLDFKRYQRNDIYESLYKLMRHKFRDTKFDLVITSDDGALNFIREYNDEYFNNIPKIFCGINNFSNEMITGIENITGVTEQNDIKSTLDLIKEIHPNKNKLVVITDTTLTTIEVLKVFNNILDLGDYNFELDILNSRTEIELLKKFNNYDKEKTVGFVIGYFLDEKGNFDSYQLRLNSLSNKIDIPLYGVWDILIGHGIVGGRLTDSYDQGKAAGRLAQQVLSGFNINDIPISQNVPNHYKFDYKYLQKFNISENILPNNSFVINKSTTKLNLDYKTVITVALLFVFLLISLLLLIAYSIKRKKVEKNLLRAKQEAEKANKLKTEFLAQMSHEIRTPVNTIMSFSALIKSSLVNSIDEDLNNCFSSIESGGRRLIRTIDLIIKMAEVQAGSIELKKKNIKFYEKILVPVVDEFRSLAYDKKLSLELINDSTNECKTKIDIHTMRQIVANLLDNAIKYTFKGSIKLTFKQDDNNCILTIVDTGIGISEDYLNNIFQPFTQEEQGYTRQFEGNGLGMALVKSYCDLNDVDIKIESQKGNGTKIILSVKMKKDLQFTVNL